MLHVVEKELQYLQPTDCVAVDAWSCLNVVREYSCSLNNQLGAWRGPLLMGTVLVAPWIPLVLSHMTLSLLLEGLAVLVLFSMGAYWFVLDVSRITRAYVHGKLQSIVLDDLLHQWFDPQRGYLVSVFGTFYASFVAYYLPLVTLEHRLQLARSILGLTPEQARVLLCQPGGIQLLWNRQRDPVVLNSNETDAEPMQKQQDKKDEPSLRPVSTDVEESVPPVPEITTTSTITSCAGLVKDMTSSKMIGSDENSTTTSIETHEGHSDSSHEQLQRHPGETATATELEAASRQQPPQQHETVSVSPAAPSPHSPPHPLTIFHSIFTTYLSQHYVEPYLPQEQVLERYLSLSIAIVFLQLLCSRRSRQLVSGALQALVLLGTTSVAACCLTLLLVRSPAGDNKECNNTLQDLGSRNRSKLDQYAHLLAHRLVRGIRQHPPQRSMEAYYNKLIELFESMAQLLDSKIHNWRQQEESMVVMTDWNKMVASWLRRFHMLRYFSVKHHVTRPIVRAVEKKKQSLSAILLVIVLAHWKHQRRNRLRIADAKSTTTACML